MPPRAPSAGLFSLWAGGGGLRYIGGGGSGRWSAGSSGARSPGLCQRRFPASGGCSGSGGSSADGGARELAMGTAARLLANAARAWWRCRAPSRGACAIAEACWRRRQRATPSRRDRLFAVESRLAPAGRGAGSRRAAAAALTVRRPGVWEAEHNSGVLILRAHWPERAIEIVRWTAARGVPHLAQ